MSKARKRYPVIEGLLGSKVKAKMLKFLFRNYPVGVSARDLALHIQEPSEAVAREIRTFENIGLVKKTR